MSREFKMENTNLYHAGIKGMKWGVRRYQNSDGTLTDAGKKRYGGARRKNRKEAWSDDAKSVYELRKKKPDQMSNAELRKYNERVRLEQEYSRLNRGTIMKGLAAVATITAAMNTINNFSESGSKIVKLGKKVTDALANDTYTLKYPR